MSMSNNPFGDRVRIVDRRKVNYQNIDKHIDLQPGDAFTKTLAKLKLPELRRMADAAVDRGDFQTADRARAAAEMRMTGVPPELTGPGQLHEVTSFDPRLGRAKTEYFGDPRVWRSQFDLPGQSGMFPPAKSFERIEGTVEIAGHETLIARTPDGSERIVTVHRKED